MSLTKPAEPISHDEPATQPDSHHGWLPDLTLVAVAFIWGINIPIMKSGLQQLDNVYLFNAVRLPISALVLTIFALRERRAGVVPDASVTWWQIGIYSVIVSMVYQLCFLIGINWTTPGNTALIIATVPIWTALLAHLFLAESLRVIAWLGLAVGVAGTMIVALQKGVSLDSGNLVGNLVVLAAALLWAIGTVYSRPLLNKISAMQLASTASIIALPAHFLVAAVNYEPGCFAPLGSPSLWLIVLYSGTLSSGLAQPMWHYGVKTAGPAHAAIVQNLVPVFALLAAWILSSEVPNTAQIVGGALILAGLVIMRWSRFVKG